MRTIKERFALHPVRTKVTLAFLFGCLATVLSLVIARFVFNETLNTIDVITRPNPKLLLVNELFRRINLLDKAERIDMLNLLDKPYTSFQSESNEICGLLDSLQPYCAPGSLQEQRILRMKGILYERNEHFKEYLAFRGSILKRNVLSRDIRNLSGLVSKSRVKEDSSFVKTTIKNYTTAVTVKEDETVKQNDKKEPFFKRLFSKKKEKESSVQTPQQQVMETVEIRVDTFTVAQRDSLAGNVEKLVNMIEQSRNKRRALLADHELRLITASQIFLEELQILLREIQVEEIKDVQQNTSLLSNVFNVAFSRIEIILGIFLGLILMLVLMIFYDISKSNRRGKELVEAKERAEHLEKVKHRFLANMSHEIRTPLQAILGYSEQLKLNENINNKSVEAIYRSSEHLLQIVNEVLDYSRIVSGKFTIEDREFDMREVIADVADILSVQAEQKNLEFKLRANLNSDVLYQGDPFRLKQILFNLVGNAIKFTHRGEVCLSISATEESEKTNFTFEISDTGIGMTQQELDRVFNHFEQGNTDIQRLYGGTGLGLTITKDLIEMQGGRIDITSEKNKGSKLKFNLSYKRINVVKESDWIYENKESAKLSFLGTTIFVDDDAFILELCSSVLKKYKLKHKCFSSAEQLLNQPLDTDIKIVFLDIRMPGIGGVDLLKRLKQKLSPGVKYYALTAQALDDEKNKLIQSGFDAVLLKPFREADLIKVFVEMGAEKELADKGSLNLSYIESMCVNDEKMIRENISVFIEQTKKDVDQLKINSALADIKNMREACHKLAPKIEMVGYSLLAARLKECERYPEEGGSENFQENINTIIPQVEEILEQMKEYKL